jgi:hypothetical protein
MANKAAAGIRRLVISEVVRKSLVRESGAIRI